MMKMEISLGLNGHSQARLDLSGELKAVNILAK